MRGLEQEAGEFRSRPVGVVNQAGEIVHFGTLPQYVPDAVTNLLEWVKSSELPMLIRSCVFHYEFELIHPFADGNGRVGRTLLNYWLMLNDHPPLIVYDEDKQDYYKALQQYDEEEILEPLVTFFQRETVQTWQRALEMDQGQRQQRKGFIEFL